MPEFTNNPLASSTFTRKSTDTKLETMTLILHTPCWFEDGLVQYWYSHIETIDDYSRSLIALVGGSSILSLTECLFRIPEIAAKTWGPSIGVHDEDRNMRYCLRDFARKLSTRAINPCSESAPETDSECADITRIAEDTFFAHSAESIVPCHIEVGKPIKKEADWLCPVLFINSEKFHLIRDTNALFALASAFRQVDRQIATKYNSCTFKLQEGPRPRRFSLDQIRQLYFRNTLARYDELYENQSEK